MNKKPVFDRDDNNFVLFKRVSGITFAFKFPHYQHNTRLLSIFSPFRTDLQKTMHSGPTSFVK